MLVSLKSVARRSAYLIAAIIIMAAILVAVTRMLTPVLDQHRADFARWASDLLQKPVTINSVRVSWYGYEPEISLNEVTVLDTKTHNPILQIDKVSVFISIPQSLWQHKIVPGGIMISGTDVNVHENEKGEITIQGFPAIGGFNSQPYASESTFTDMLAWLSLQPRLILRDIDVRYKGFTGQKRFVTLYNLGLENSGSEHYISGKAVLHQEIPTEVTLALQWQAANADLAAIDANAYVYVSGLNLAQWMKGFVWKGWDLRQGVTSAKIWLAWKHGAWQKIQGNFQAYDLNLHSQADQSTHKINRLSGNLGWKRDGSSQIIAGEDILMDLPARLWPVTSFYLVFAPGADGALAPQSVKFAYANLSDIQSLALSTSGLLSASQRETLAGIGLTGSVENTSITFPAPWNDWQHIALESGFSQAGLRPWRQWPGMNNLSGSVKWDGTSGSLNIKSLQSEFRYDTLFANSLSLQQLSGSAQFRRDQNNWSVQIPALQVLNKDLAANLSGSLTLTPGSLPVVDLKANLVMPQARRINEYLPMRIFDPDLANWLREAILSGEIKSAHAELKGALADFPFDDNNGIFLISAAVNNVDLHYAPEWPDLKGVAGKLEFSGRKMTVNVDQAQIANIPVTNVRAVIPYLGEAQPQVLQVNADEIKTDFSQALAFVHASPLEKTIGKMFAGVEVSGPVALRLGLTIPLKKPDNTEVQGSLDIQDAEMNLVPWKLDLSHILGQANFTDKTLDAENISAQLFNKPLHFNLATQQKTKDMSIVQASFATVLEMSDLEDWLKLPFTTYAQGAADVGGSIDFSLQQPMKVNLNSNLAGIAIDLPDPFGKKADENRDFSASITMSEAKPLQLNIDYGNLLSTALVLNRKEDKFSLASADVQFKGSLPVFGQQLTQPRLQLLPVQNNWNITIASPEVSGQIQVPAHITRQGLITARFDKMNVRAQSAASTITKVDIKSLPSISFLANNFTYNNMPLGQVSIKAVPQGDKMNLQSLHIVSANMDLQATGDWKQNSTGYVTHLKGSAMSAHVSDFLSSLGFDVHNFVSSNGRLDFKLNWDDAPYAPNLSSMSGSASLSMGAGRIVDIGQGGNAKMGLGQLLSIFSLQTIPRRLSFDFSDVFQKGYSFDVVKGSFDLDDGDATTKDFYFDGPVAKVGIVGEIGLKDQDFNFTLIVTPYVTSSIPIAATLITMNPLVGLGAFAVNTVLGSQFSKVTTYYYEVTGPWSNPVWKSLKVYKPG